MGLLRILNKKYEIMEQNNSSKSKNDKKEKFHSLAEFVEYSLKDNGGNYEDIYIKLNKILTFVNCAKQKGIDGNFERINETLQDFFNKKNHIKFNIYKNLPYSAFYYKKDKFNYYNYRGITIAQDEQKNPILYFGRRNKEAATHSKDTMFCFRNNSVVFQDECMASYDEIPLYGDGVFAIFDFDSNNKLIKISYRYMTDTRLGFWSDEQIYELSNTNKYKLIS